MSDVWVANASPVIVLAKVSKLELLTGLSTELLLPEPVVAEILAGPDSDPARHAVEAGWGGRDVGGTVPSKLLEWGLGPGETSVLAVALKRSSATAVLDDVAGRSCANVFGVPVIGTLGVILRAKRMGLIGSAAEVMTALRDAGLHLDDLTIRSALERLGEKW